jgi:DegV family protein with EDD domain
MSNIAIVTDSTANLPCKWVEQYLVHVVPLKVHWGDETYRDGVDITTEEFYTKLAQSKALPTTSQPSVQDFLQVFESLAGQAQAIVAPLISSGISGTVTAAQLAARDVSQIPVEIVDTKVTSMGQVLIILAVARAIEQGKSLQEVKQEAEAIARRIHVFFAVDTLEYLHRGGRINTASRYLGTLLDVKPILYFNDDGKIDALERARTKKKALGRLLELAEDRAGGRAVHVGIVQANSPEVAQEFQAEAERRLICKEIFTVECSPNIAVHVGPGAIGIALYPDEG